MSESRVAALLRARAGVGTLLSESEAAGRCGLSRQTLSKVMRGLTRDIKPTTLDKLANGLGIDRKLLGLEALVDAGHIQVSGSGSSVAETLAQIQRFSDHDLGIVQVELGRMQQARAAQRMRDSAASTE
jgi:transcriptional regulator with XRE-family HTH domain